MPIDREKALAHESQGGEGSYEPDGKNNPLQRSSYR